MIDELRMPQVRGGPLSGRPAAAEGRGPGGFDVALGDALEPARPGEMPPGVGAPERRASRAPQERTDRGPEGNPTERLLRSRRQAERQPRHENRPATREDAGRAAGSGERAAEATAEADSTRDPHRRLAPEVNDPSSAQPAPAPDDAAAPSPASAAPLDGPVLTDAARPQAPGADAAALMHTQAVLMPRPSAARPTGGAAPGQAAPGEVDPLAAASGAPRHAPAAAPQPPLSDASAASPAPVPGAPNRQPASLAADPAMIGAGGAARQAAIGLGTGTTSSSDVRAGDSPAVSAPGGGPRRDGSVSALTASFGARVDWRPGGGAAGSQAGEQGGTGSGDLGAPARLLAALEEMRQSGGSASPQGAAAFAAALSSSLALTGPASSPGAAEPAPTRLSNPWPVDHPAFPAHLAEQVGDSLLAGLDRAEITVTPPEMGPIRIELSLNGELASVAFSATQPDTRTAIEQSLPLLRSMLSEQGLQLADTSVGSGYRPPAEPGGQSPAGDGSGSRGTGQSGGRTGGADAAPATSSTGAAASASRGNGLLDLFA